MIKIEKLATMATLVAIIYCLYVTIAIIYNSDKSVVESQEKAIYLEMNLTQEKAFANAQLWAERQGLQPFHVESSIVCYDKTTLDGLYNCTAKGPGTATHLIVCDNYGCVNRKHIPEDLK